MTSDDLEMPKEMFNKQYSLVFRIVQRYAIFLMLQSNYCSKWLSFLMPPDSGKTSTWFPPSIVWLQVQAFKFTVTPSHITASGSCFFFK